MSSGIKYRPEIDGIRAVAVLLVLFYHFDFDFFGKSLFQGGFLGGDVFFVISGYLITNTVTSIAPTLMAATLMCFIYYHRFSSKFFRTCWIWFVVMALIFVSVFKKEIMNSLNS